MKKNLDDLEKIAKQENVSKQTLEKNVKKGSTIIVRNKNREKPIAIGKDTRVKINTNIGTSPDDASVEKEIQKAKTAEKYGTHTIMDLSTGGNLDQIRKKLLKKTSLPLGTVPMYQAVVEHGLGKITEEQILKTFEKHIREVDFVTVHAGMTFENLKKTKKRLMGIVSRGGSFLACWMSQNQKENPLYANYEHLLEAARASGCAISLGDALRPGCLRDANDEAQNAELKTIGKLVGESRKKNVPAMVEGPGHMKLNQIADNVRLEKKLCKNAPYYVLGPLVSDLFAGYDHISAAIGGAVAGMHGVDYLCVVAPSEHLGLPDKEDIKNGVIASRIAAHAADLSRGKDEKLDDEMSLARRKLDWKKQFSLVVDKKKALEYRKRKKPEAENTCTMCGKYCAIKMYEKSLEKL